MNLTRRILEGIHEVELEITPEFKKPEQNISISDLTSMLKERGWHRVEVNHLESVDVGPGKSMVMTVQEWEYGEVHGLKLVIRRHTSWVGYNPVPEEQVAEVIAWTAAWGEEKIEPPTEEMIGSKLLELQMKYHMGHWPTDPPSAGEDPDAAYDALAEIGWKVMSSAGKGGVRYAKEGVPDNIVVVSQGDKITGAWIEYQDGGHDNILPPTIDNIVTKAEYTEGLYSSGHEEGPTDEVGALDNAMATIDWKVVASSASKLMYQREGVPDSIVVKEGGGGSILSAKIVYDDGTDIIISDPTIEKIVSTAEFLTNEALEG